MKLFRQVVNFPDVIHVTDLHPRTEEEKYIYTLPVVYFRHSF